MFERLVALGGLIRARTVEVDGLRLQVPPGVLDPVLFRSGAWFARQVARRVRTGQRLLDLGCGSGVVGLLAARAGATVVAVDIEGPAVEAARRNGLQDVRQGDLFTPVRGESFDLIAFNPPYLRGRPHGRLPAARSLSAALYGGDDLDVVRTFAREVGAHLAPGGVALVCWSDRAVDPARTVLGGEWEQATSAVIDAELLSLYERPDPTTRRPPKASRGR